ncbi:hypothetical protein [Kordia sp.]|uniref:hypothetical protein n=1 Tax=Kordia sp. TaxID=1965332 RepID=UPI003D6C486E
MTKNTFPCTFRYILFLFTVSLFSLLYSCGSSPEDTLVNKVKKGLREDNTIDEKEWNDISTYISDNKDSFKQLYSDTDNIISDDKLENYILTIASKRRDNESPKIIKPKKASTVDKKTHVKVFIENSASMDGYVTNTTEFEAAISELLVQIKYHYDSEAFDVSFINEEIHPSKVDEIEKFVEALEPNRLPYEVGVRTSSKLNEILKMVLENTSKDNISIFVSDCIYSLSKKGDTKGALAFEKSLTKSAFAQKTKEFDFSTLILKMHSNFEGTYYDYENVRTNLSKKQRPYYIWIIGSDNQMFNFLDRINLDQLKGFDNFYLATNLEKNKNPFFSILRETNKIGTFKQIDRSSRIIKDIENVKLRDGKFQFTVAVDLKDINVSSTTLFNKENYKISDGFIINNIQRITPTSVHKRDYPNINKTPATHIFTIELKPEYGISNLELSLNKSLPNWVSNSSSSDDKNIMSQLDKTFGLNYIMEGVEEAYLLQDSDNTTHFTINIEIKK